MELILNERNYYYVVIIIDNSYEKEMNSTNENNKLS